MKLPFEALELMHIHPSLRVETLTSHNFNNNPKWKRNFYHDGLGVEASGKKWKRKRVEVEVVVEEDKGDGKWMVRIEVEMREDDDKIGG